MKLTQHLVRLRKKELCIFNGLVLTIFIVEDEKKKNKNLKKCNNVILFVLTLNGIKMHACINTYITAQHTHTHILSSFANALCFQNGTQTHNN